MTNIINILFEYIGQAIYYPNFYMRRSRKGTGGTDPYPHSRKIKPSSAHLVCTGCRFSSEYFIQTFLVDGSKRYQNVGSPPDTFLESGMFEDQDKRETSVLSNTEKEYIAPF